MKEIIFNKQDVNMYVSRYFNVLKDIEILKTDIKQLKHEYKDKVNFQLVNKVISLIKIQIKLEGTAADTREELQNIISEKINMVLE